MSDTKVNSLKVIQGRKAEVVKTTKTLTHKDIKQFFVKYAEAIFVDQERVNKMPRKHFHPLYDNGRWRGTREEYLDAIVDLSLTVDKMPKRLLKNLTELAITYGPDAVKRPLFQVQPLIRECYRDPSFEVHEAADLGEEDWRRFAATITPNTDHMRAPGHYAVDTRKRLRGQDGQS